MAITNIGVAIPAVASALNSGGSNTHPNYLAILDMPAGAQTSKERGLFPMYTVLPENYSISVGADYDTPFADMGMAEKSEALKEGFTRTGPSLSNTAVNVNRGLSGLSGFFKGMQGAASVGMSSVNKYQLIQIYQSGQPLTFSIDFFLHANTNSSLEVKQKLVALLKLAAPIEIGGGMLKVPGINFANLENSRLVSLTLGNFLKLEACIITNVSADIPSLCGPDGIPLSVKVNVTLESACTTTTDKDLDLLFKKG